MDNVAQLVLGNNQANNPAVAAVVTPQPANPAQMIGATVVPPQNQTPYQQQSAVVAATNTPQGQNAGYMVVQQPQQPPPPQDPPGSYRPGLQNPNLQPPLQQGPGVAARPDTYFDAVSRAIANTPGLSFFYGLGAAAGRNGVAEKVADTLETAPGLSPIYQGGEVFEARQNAAYLSDKAADAVNRAERAGLIQDGKFVGSESQFIELSRTINAAESARNIDQSMSSRAMGNPITPWTMPLANWAAGAGQWITNTGSAAMRSGDSLVPGAAPVTHFLVGAGEGVAQLVPFAAMALPAVEWGARNPGALAATVVPGGAAQVAGMVEAARDDPFRFAGNIVGMVAGPKAAGLAARETFGLRTIGISTELGGENRYTMVMAKPPWGSWGASGQALLTVARGAEYERPQLLVGNAGMQEALTRTTVRMPAPWDMMNAVQSPELEVFTKNLIEAGRPTNPELSDLIQTYEGTRQTVSNPIQRATFYSPVQKELFGELPTASASHATMAEIFRSAEQRGDIVFSGSRANVRPFTAPSARGAEGFGGTMADFDVLMKNSALPEVFEQWRSIVARENPNAVAEMRSTPEGLNRFSISTGQGKFINAESFEEFPTPHSRFNTLIVEAVGGAKVRVPGPAFALEAKLSGATRGAILEYSPEGGMNLHLSETARVKDWPDFTSTARGIARDLYSSVSMDIEGFSGEGVIQSMKTARAGEAERLSDLSQAYAEKNAPGSSAMYREFSQDILKGVDRNPVPLHTVTPGQIGAGAVVGATLIGVTSALPATLKLVFLGLTGGMRPGAEEIYKIRMSVSGIENELYGTSLTGKEIVSPIGLMGTAGYDTIRRTGGNAGDPFYQSLRGEGERTYPSVIAERAYGSVYPGNAAVEVYPQVTAPINYPKAALLTETYSATSPRVMEMLYPSLTNPESYQTTTPLQNSITHLPPGSQKWIPPEVMPPASMSESLRTWSPSLDWHFERRNKRPFRFVELFSFELPGGETPVPYRFGKGGPIGAIRNPQLVYLEGPSTPAKKILWEEAYGLAGMGRLTTLRESAGIRNLRRDRL